MPLISDLRFFLYPDPSNRHVLAVAELAVCGDDLEVLCELPTPIDADDFNEDAVRDLFLAMPSGASH